MGRMVSELIGHVWTIFFLNNSLRLREEAKKETFCSFIDFQKAFNYVNHNFLFHKLIDIGINGNIYHAVKHGWSAQFQFMTQKQ